jgi:hypothetical protein
MRRLIKGKERMEIILTNNSRIRLLWHDRDRSLSLQLWQPMTQSDGHGLMYAGEAVLSGDDLAQFLSGLRPPEPDLPLAA